MTFTALQNTFDKITAFRTFNFGFIHMWNPKKYLINEVTRGFVRCSALNRNVSFRRSKLPEFIKAMTDHFLWQRHLIPTDQSQPTHDSQLSNSVNHLRPTDQLFLCFFCLFVFFLTCLMSSVEIPAYVHWQRKRRDTRSVFPFTVLFSIPDFKRKKETDIWKKKVTKKRKQDEKKRENMCETSNGGTPQAYHWWCCTDVFCRADDFVLSSPGTERQSTPLCGTWSRAWLPNGRQN